MSTYIFSAYMSTYIFYIYIAHACENCEPIGDIYES